MTDRAVRITAVPRTEHPNSGLQAMHFASHYGDDVWALPAPGAYIGGYGRVTFFLAERFGLHKVLPFRLIRAAFLLWLFVRVALLPGRLFFVHSFIFAIPLWLLRRRYCIFVHGTDRRFLDKAWARAVAARAICVFGVGFGSQSGGVNVREVPNIFIPSPVPAVATVEHDLVFVLRNAPVKNPTYPLTLAEHLGGGLGVRIAVLGVSAEELSSDDRSRLDRLQGAGVRIHYLGRQPYEQVVDVMGKSRILMIPSFSEGLPKVLLEGMSQGLHVIINRALRFPQEIMDRVDHVELEDWAAITRIMESQRSSGRCCANIGFASRYLQKSQQSLFLLYDGIYSRHLGASISGGERV